jgi:hypothetical protein
MQDKKRIGRPIKPGVSGARVSLGLRVTGDTKSRLDNAALASGRSQSQEAELRLEQSFRDDRIEAMLREILERLDPPNV